ncbi:MAG: hypothetical protein J3K34DRAFT_88685 [Monoraphidium minutum]|nr:MAG: hypothetical protein J3K34DRAFT_88685 [Monoraphidium minutum]
MHATRMVHCSAHTGTHPQNARLISRGQSTPPRVALATMLSASPTCQRAAPASGMVGQAGGARGARGAASRAAQLAPLRRAPARVAAAARRPTSSAAGGSGVTQSLQLAEVAALSTAALVQVATLLSAAARAQQEGAAALSAGRAQREDHQQRQVQASVAQPAMGELARVLPSQAALAPLQGFAVVVALVCSALLRRLQSARSMLGGTPTIDAAARLVRLEAALQQQAAAAALTSRQLDKLQARVRVSSADIQAPLRQAQETGAATADALVRLAEQQGVLSRQVAGLEEVIAALQGVGARQFKVCIDALGVLKQQQVTTAERHITRMAATQQQVDALASQLGGGQQHPQQQQQQQHWSQQAAGGGSSGSSSGGNGNGAAAKAGSGAAPDPWTSR